MDNGQLQWTIDNGQWTIAMDNGQWTMDNCEIKRSMFGTSPIIVPSCLAVSCSETQ
ncbi:MAG: hypothetical protein FWF88_07205 [Peptococcaceae bacterium]|nr:hypothetical protein [Peptococcaceae bacterium]